MENPQEGENKQTPQAWPNATASSPTPVVVVSADTPPAPIFPPSSPAPVQSTPMAPVPAPVIASATPLDNNPDQPHTSRSSTIILQWLTYAFWGWTVLTLSGLTALVFARLIAGEDSSTVVYYMIAGIVVLLPVSFFCDITYSKKEPAKKVGPSSLVMVIYAVIFAIFAIGSLLVAAWEVVSLITIKLDRSGFVAGLLSALFIFVFYIATFMRTLNPSHISWIPRIYRFTMLGVILVFIILGLAKPTFHSVKVSVNNSPAVNSGRSLSTSQNTATTPSTPSNNSVLEPTAIGGTQCDNPTLSDGSTTGQMAVSGGATCSDADSAVQSANNRNGANYSSGGYSCTGTQQGSNTQWSDYWNNDFYTYSCANGSKQVAFNLQTSAQRK